MGIGSTPVMTRAETCRSEQREKSVQVAEKTHKKQANPEPIVK
jgi:hypothetical protein